MQPEAPLGVGLAGHRQSQGDLLDRGLSLIQGRAGLPLLLTLVAAVVAVLWSLQRQAAGLYRAVAVQGAAVQAQTVFDLAEPEGAPLPAALVRRIDERLGRQQPGIHARLLDDQPTPDGEPPQPQPDAFEQEALRALREHPDQPFSRIADYEGRPSLRYARADPAGGGVLEIIRRHMRLDHTVFVGVIDPINPAVETPELVRDRILVAARYLPPSQLGTTDDCGFAPFADDTSTSRDTAFEKIRARVLGTQLAARQI